MKAQSLRQGNLVLLDNEKIVRLLWFRTEHACIMALGVTYPSAIVSLDRLEPIPLTEDWLLKFGFRFDSIDWEFPKDSIFFIGWYAGKFCLGSGSDGVTKENYIEYVHQLQNLYFALTNEELEVKANQV